jgi:hypothetical protein
LNAQIRWLPWEFPGAIDSDSVARTASLPAGSFAAGHGGLYGALAGGDAVA